MSSNLSRTLSATQPMPVKIPSIQKKTSIANLLENLDDPIFTCYFCDKNFTSFKYLKLHHKRHFDEKENYPCRFESTQFMYFIFGPKFTYS